MACALAVSSFPEPASVDRTPQVPPKDVPYRSHSRQGKRDDRLTPPPPIDIPSVVHIGHEVRLDGDDQTGPGSPLVFRTFEDPGNNWNDYEQRTIESVSPSSRFVTALGSCKHITSTKDGIASLGVSASCPAPNYDFLSPLPRYKEDNYLTIPRPSLPTRSTSLPIYTLSKLGVDVMSRPTSPAHSVAGDVNLRDPAEPNSGSSSQSSSPSSPASSASSLSLWRGRKLWTGTLSRGDIASPRSLSPASSISSYSQYPPSVRTPFDAYASTYPSPLAMTSATGGYFSAYMTPTPLQSPRTPRPQPKISTDCLTPLISPVSPSEKLSMLSLRRVRKLMTRRSISSFDALSDGGAGDQDSSCTPDSADGSRMSMDSDISAGPPDIKVIEPEDNPDAPRIYTHLLVGDVWEERDISDVIPALRSLRFAGRV